MPAQKRAAGSDVERERKGVKCSGIERTERVDLTKILGQLDFLEQNESFVKFTAWMHSLM